MAVNLTKRIKGMFATEAHLLPKSLVSFEFLTKLGKFLLTNFV